MSQDDISHAAHVIHLQDRLRDLESERLRWAQRWEAFITGEHRAMKERAEAAERELARVRLGDGGTQRITEAYRALARSMKIDPSPANAERVRDEAAAAVALRDEMRGERDKARTLAGTIAERAEKAERERDETRVALKSAADALVALWGAIGDRLLAGGRLAREYANSVSEQCRSAERACRAALGEKP